MHSYSRARLIKISLIIVNNFNGCNFNFKLTKSLAGNFHKSKQGLIVLHCMNGMTNRKERKTTKNHWMTSKNNMKTTCMQHTFAQMCGHAVINNYLPIKAVACANACRLFSLCCLLTFSASASPSWSRFLGSGILKVGPGVPVMGVSPPSKRKGVPSMLPHVIRGDASTPEVTKTHQNVICCILSVFQVYLCW